MEENINRDILDKLTKVCICKSITRDKIKKAIINGADTFEKLQEKTGAGTGECGAKKCREKIEELILSLI